MTLKLMIYQQYKGCHPENCHSERSRRGAMGFMLRLRSAGQNGSAFNSLIMKNVNGMIRDLSQGRSPYRVCHLFVRCPADVRHDDFKY